MLEGGDDRLWGFFSPANVWPVKLGFSLQLWLGPSLHTFTLASGDCAAICMHMPTKRLTI